MNSLLDVARQTYKEANTDAAGLVAQLSGDARNIHLTSGHVLTRSRNA